jgi:hypothetical protein
MQAAKEKTNLAVAGLDVEVTMKGNRATFKPTPATPQNLGRIQMATKDWLASLGHGGTATISGGAVIAEVTGHTFSGEEIEKAGTYLTHTFTQGKGGLGAAG